jgi:hypothetical protein
MAERLSPPSVSDGPADDFACLALLSNLPKEHKYLQLLLS